MAEYKNDVCRCGHERRMHYVWKLECHAREAEGNRCFCKRFRSANEP